MHLTLLLLTFIFLFTRTSADFRLTHYEENTVTLFCQLVAPEGTTFQYIIPYITRDNDTQELEFRDIQDNMDDSRYFGIQYPDISSKNLIGIIIIRNFRDSDLQNNFKCSQSLFNGTLIEYSLTTTNEHTATPPTSSYNHNTTHPYSSKDGSKPKGVSPNYNVTYHGVMYIPACIPCNVMLLVVGVFAAFLIICLLVIVIILRNEFKEKILCRMLSIFKRRKRTVPIVGYHMPDNTVDVPNDADTHSGSSSSQVFYSLRSEGEDLSEPAPLRLSSIDGATYTPLKVSN